MVPGSPSPGRQEKEALETRLFLEGEEELAEVLQKCGNPLSLTCTHCGNRHMTEERCKKRWCPMCAPRISAERLSLLRYAIKKMKWPLAVMLSVRNTASARGCFAKLRKSFYKFRKTRFWKENVSGGIVALELTNTGQGWHPHIHCIVDCEWLSLTVPKPRRTERKHQVKAKCKAAQQELSERWATCIKQDTAVVWANRKTGKHLEEAVKYAIKPGTLIESLDAIGDAIRAMKGTRLVGTFGNLHGLKKQWEDEEKTQHEGTPCKQCNQIGTMLPTEVLDILVRQSNKPQRTTGAFRSTQRKCA
jgi:hypothetical protein